jgi:6-phosphogluconolactonase
MFAYVGCYTSPERDGHGKGISVFRVDKRTGGFTPVQLLPFENPSFLALSRDGRFLYSVHGDRSEANAFTVDQRTGKIAHFSRQPTGGYNPVHLEFDASGRFLAIANYTTDSMVALPVRKDGSLGPYTTLTTVTGTQGPHKVQQRGLYPHHNPLDPTGKFFYVPCKGGDCVIAYRLDAKKGVLVESARVTSRPAAGPRHIAFHPKKPLAWVTNELNSTLTTYRLDRKTGGLTPLQTIPSAPESFNGYSTGAEIGVSRDGRHLYVSNRGHDSVGVFKIDPKTGWLSPLQWVPSGGTVPRFFAFDPAERFLYIANQGGNSILIYSKERSGKLAATGRRIKTPSPACIVFS